MRFCRRKFSGHPNLSPCWWTVPFLLGASLAHAQVSTSQTGWYQYFGDHPLSKHWGLHGEMQWRRDNIITSWEQLLLRTGGTYKFNKHVSTTLGYTYLRTFRYGEIPRSPTREHRVYEELKLSHTLWHIDWEHRFRLEQRFSANQRDYNWKYGNRVRYRLQGRIPLGARKVDEGRLYLSFYDELFEKWGAAGGPQALDQNRVYGALGINLTEKNKMEIGYLYRYFPQTDGTLQQEHSLQVSIFSQSNIFRRNIKD